MESSRGSFQTVSIVFLIVGLIVGVGGGYFYVASTYQPKMKDYENQINELNSDITDLNTFLSTLEADKTDYLEQISTLESENSDNQDEILNIQTQLNEAQNTISENENELSSLRSQSTQWSAKVSDLQSQLDEIGDIEVTQHYEWEYGTGYLSSEWSWDLPFFLSTYIEYYFRPRPTDWEDWIDMIKDPYDDYYIDSMIQEINSAAIKQGFTESEKVNFVIAFVQNLPYTEDSVTTDWDEYPRYPIETLFDRGGDCEDTSILVATLLDRMGYDVCLLLLSYENHCAVGVNIASTYGTYYEHNGRKFYYLETTGEGWEIGDMPPDFTDTRAYVYPVNP